MQTENGFVPEPELSGWREPMCNWLKSPLGRNNFP